MVGKSELLGFNHDGDAWSVVMADLGSLAMNRESDGGMWLQQGAAAWRRVPL
jgi:hypothetical protein